MDLNADAEEILRTALEKKVDETSEWFVSYVSVFLIQVMLLWKQKNTESQKVTLELNECFSESNERNQDSCRAIQWLAVVQFLRLRQVFPTLPEVTKFSTSKVNDVAPHVLDGLVKVFGRLFGVSSTHCLKHFFQDVLESTAYVRQLQLCRLVVCCVVVKIDEFEEDCIVHCFCWLGNEDLFHEFLPRVLSRTSRSNLLLHSCMKYAVHGFGQRFQALCIVLHTFEVALHRSVQR